MSDEPPSITEDALCECFAEAVKEKPDFMLWLLSKTKFSPFADQVRLLHEEQMSIRPRKRWWRHWWCHVPELAKDRETDIFMVFEHSENTSSRFAIHVENKKDFSRFNSGQAEAYAPRARHMCNKTQFLNHTDFATIVIAPVRFITRFPADCAHFDAAIPHEDIAGFVPAFRS